MHSRVNDLLSIDLLFSLYRHCAWGGSIIIARELIHHIYLFAQLYVCTGAPGRGLGSGGVKNTPSIQGEIIPPPDCLTPLGQHSCFFLDLLLRSM